MAASPTPTPAPSPRGAPSPLLNPRLGITVNSLGSSHRRKGEGETRRSGLSPVEGGKQLSTGWEPAGPSAHRSRLGRPSTCWPPPPSPAARPASPVSRRERCVWGGGSQQNPGPLLGHRAKIPLLGLSGTQRPQGLTSPPSPASTPRGRMAPRTRVRAAKTLSSNAAG